MRSHNVFGHEGVYIVVSGVVGTALVGPSEPVEEVHLAVEQGR